MIQIGEAIQMTESPLVAVVLTWAKFGILAFQKVTCYSKIEYWSWVSKLGFPCGKPILDPKIAWWDSISHTTPSMVYYDNLSTALLAANPVLHSKSKPFELDLHFAREGKCLDQPHSSPCSSGWYSYKANLLIFICCISK